MNWFDEQLKYRKEKDDENFADAIVSVAGAIMGKRLTESLDSEETAQSAMEEILRYYHCKIRTEELPSGIKTIEDQLEFRMRPYGIMRRKINLDKGWYNHAVGAILGTLKEDGSAVALIPGKFRGYSYLHLKTGKRVKLTGKTEKLIDAEAVCFYKPLPLKSLTVKDLLLFMAEQFSISDVVMYIGMMAVAALLGLLSPLFTKWLFGDVLESGSTTVLLALAGFMVCFSLCRLFISVFQALINSRIGTKQNIAVQAAVMNRIMSLPTKFFKDYAAGELTQRAAYVQNLCSLFMNTMAP